MSKRTLFLIIALLSVTGLLLALALGQKNTSPFIPNLKPSPVSQAQTVLAINPNPVSLSSPSASVTVEVNSGENNLTAVQLELSYDPKMLTNVVVTPGSYFDHPVVLINTVNTGNGRISYAIAIPPGRASKKGQGAIAVISFTANIPAGDKTQIQFLPSSLVTAQGIEDSVLKSTSGTTIMPFLLDNSLPLLPNTTNQ